MSKAITKEYLEKQLKNYKSQVIVKNFVSYEDGKLSLDGNEIEGITDGKSAYEVACDNGFEGSEEEWLESLMGKSITSIETDENNNVIVTFSDGSTQNIGQLDIDVQADFLTEGGFGNLRYYNGHFQYYNTSTSSWVDTSVTPENVYLINMIPQSMKHIMGVYDVDLGYNKLKFEEPGDTIIEGQSACIVEKVIIRRKLGSAPISETDGILVDEISRKNFGKYKNAWYVDDAFEPAYGEVWYYKAFPVSTTGFVNAISLNETSISCKDHYLFGFVIDQNESDPASMITYIEDNKNYKSAYMDYTADKFNYGDWENAWFIRDLKPCMLNYDGTVAYYLDKNDYTKKEDGTASDVSNENFEGNAMIGFPKVYWKIVDNGDDTASIYFSNKKVDDDFVCWSHIDNNGNEIDYCYMPIYNGSNVNNRLRSISGKKPIYSKTANTEITYALSNNQTEDIIWYTELFSDRQLLTLLLLLIGKSTNTQTIFGNGNMSSTASESGLLTTGTLNTNGLFYGTDKETTAVKTFGIENLWGNQWRRIAGWINDKGIQKIKLTHGQTDGSTVNGYNVNGEGYVTLEKYAFSGTNGAYIKKALFDKNGIIPMVSSNASSTTYYTDELYLNKSMVSYPAVGSRPGNGYSSGIFALHFGNNAEFTSWHYGASISCKPLATT